MSLLSKVLVAAVALYACVLAMHVEARLPGSPASQADVLEHSGRALFVKSGGKGSRKKYLQPWLSHFFGSKFGARPVLVSTF